MHALLLAFSMLAQAPVAERLARAHDLYDSLDLSEARELLLEIVASPDATDEQLMEAHLLAGQIDRIMEKDVDARMHFRWVLTRDKDAKLPPDAPPKIQTFFDLVHDEIYSTPAPPREDPPAKAQPEEAEPISPLLYAAAGTGTLALVSAVGAMAIDNQFRTPPFPPWSEREKLLTLGVTVWSISAASALAAGGFLWWGLAQ